MERNHHGARIKGRSRTNRPGKGTMDQKRRKYRPGELTAKRRGKRAREKIAALSSPGTPWPPKAEPAYHGCTPPAHDELARLLACYTLLLRDTREGAFARPQTDDDLLAAAARCDVIEGLAVACAAGILKIQGGEVKALWP